MNFYIKYKSKNKKLKFLYLRNKFLYSSILKNFILKVYPFFFSSKFNYYKLSDKDLSFAISHYNAKPQRKALRLINSIYF